MSLTGNNFYSKVSHYFPNGEGRDQYISTTNGGFFRSQYPYKFADESRVSRMNKTRSVPRIDSKALKYNYDGSGRDTYVGYNHGGLFANPNKSTFYSNLRGPDNSIYISPLINRKVASSQKQLIKRLSMPKKHLSPMKKQNLS
ncbi:hypothetical protein SteCoe_6289 [Stentor coeruleus]|uniref:Uncharacterized protein n=1 Tax=Stentor coeruleus TaxID=5963 RepID=A0A1R2CQD4_9CILI|nr:hypothetical protein SteCoe_6289 [Stentor coeruleus]